MPPSSSKDFTPSFHTSSHLSLVHPQHHPQKEKHTSSSPRSQSKVHAAASNSTATTTFGQNYTMKSATMIPNIPTSSQASSPPKHCTLSSPFAAANHKRDCPLGSSHAASNVYYISHSSTQHPTPQPAHAFAVSNHSVTTSSNPQEQTPTNEIRNIFIPVHIPQNIFLLIFDKCMPPSSSKDFTTYFHPSSHLSLMHPQHHQPKK
jgi:hypothetical protein